MSQACVKHHFPLISCHNADQGICVLEINLCIDVHLPQGVKEVWYLQKGVAIILCDVVDSPEVSAKLQETIFLLNEEGQSSMGWASEADESCGYVLINELT